MQRKIHNTGDRSGNLQFCQENTTSFPGSLFSASIVVETMEAEKRDPGNEVEENSGLQWQQFCSGTMSAQKSPNQTVVMQMVEGNVLGT